jgi:hypothetical protein
LLVRPTFALDDRTFAVLGEPWFDPESDEWKGRFVFLPLDRSFPRALPTGPLRRSRKRDDLLRWISAVTDKELTAALRALLTAPARPTR